MRRTRARCGGISKPSMVIADPSIGPLHGWGSMTSSIQPTHAVRSSPRWIWPAASSSVRVAGRCRCSHRRKQEERNGCPLDRAAGIDPSDGAELSGEGDRAVHRRVGGAAPLPQTPLPPHGRPWSRGDDLCSARRRVDRDIESDGDEASLAAHLDVVLEFVVGPCRVCGLVFPSQPNALRRLPSASQNTRLKDTRRTLPFRWDASRVMDMPRSEVAPPGQRGSFSMALSRLAPLFLSEPSQGRIR